MTDACVNCVRVNAADREVRKLAGIVLDAPTNVGGGSINVWLARDLARAAVELADCLHNSGRPRND